MFCTNCGKSIPDNSVNCPLCGAATGAAPAPAQNAAPAPAPAPTAAPMGAPAAPAGAAPQNLYAAPAGAYGPRSSFSFKSLFDVEKFAFIPVILIGIVITLMIWMHSLDLVNWKVKGSSMERAKSTYDACLEGLDTGFTSFMKFFGVLTEIGAFAGVIIALLYLNKNNLKAVKFLGISIISMCVSYIFLFIYGLHVMGEIKDGKGMGTSVKTKGGVTVSIILLMIFTLILVVYWLFAAKIIKVGNRPNFNNGFGYGAPQQFGGAPQQQFGAPQNFGAPQQQFGAPQNTGAPQNFGTPQNPGQ